MSQFLQIYQNSHNSKSCTSPIKQNTYTSPSRGYTKTKQNCLKTPSSLSVKASDLMTKFCRILLKIILIILMNSQKPILVYYEMRANVEVIRMTLYEIGVEFVQEFITHAGFAERLTEKYQLDLRDVPYLIHEGIAISGAWPIIKYCCLKFGRSDLLGKSLQDQIRVAQIVSKYMAQRSILINNIFSTLKQLSKSTQISSSLPIIKSKSFEFICRAKYFQASRKMFLETKGYLRNYLTVIDFIFFSISNFLIQMFGRQISDNTLLAFVVFFKNTAFYQRHQNNIEKYPFYNKEIDTNVCRVLRNSLREEEEPPKMQESDMNDD